MYTNKEENITARLLMDRLAIGDQVDEERKRPSRLSLEGLAGKDGKRGVALWNVRLSPGGYRWLLLEEKGERKEHIESVVWLNENGEEKVRVQENRAWDTHNLITDWALFHRRIMNANLVKIPFIFRTNTQYLCSARRIRPYKMRRKLRTCNVQ